MFLIYLVGTQAEYLREKAAKKKNIFTKVFGCFQDCDAYALERISHRNLGGAGRLFAGGCAKAGTGFY